VGGAGERRGDGVRVGSTYAKTTPKKPHQETKSKAQADFCGFRSTSATIESVSCHSRIRRDEIWVSYHHEAQFRMSVSRTRGSLLSSLGCSFVPCAIRCHQKSTSNSAGSPVGSLAPPRATPRLGGVCVSYQPSYQLPVLRTSLAPLYSPCASSAFDWGPTPNVQLPLRATPRGALPGPGALVGYRHRLSSSWLINTAVSIETRDSVGIGGQWPSWSVLHQHIVVVLVCWGRLGQEPSDRCGDLLVRPRSRNARVPNEHVLDVRLVLHEH
jgi:hypothetical protein